MLLTQLIKLLKYTDSIFMFADPFLELSDIITSYLSFVAFKYVRIFEAYIYLIASPFI